MIKKIFIILCLITLLAFVLKGSDTITNNVITIDSVGDNNLPVIFLYLQFDEKDGWFFIEWATASETNNDYFTLEKSENLEEWYLISIVNGAGNSNQLLKYQYIDKYERDKCYYRLLQTDYDGSKKLLAVKTLPGYDGSEKFKIYPNPVNKNEFLMICYKPIEQIKVCNTNGQPVHYQKWSNHIKFFEPGTYNITVNGRYTQKITVK